MRDLPKLERIEFLEDYVIRGYLVDGRITDLDFRDALDGPMFWPMRDPEEFRRGHLDETGTLVWPNGADVAPEAWLLGWPADEAAASA